MQKDHTPTRVHAHVHGGSWCERNGDNTFIRVRDSGAPLVVRDFIVSADATHSCEARMCELTRIASRSAGAAARGRERGPQRVHPPTTVGAVKVELRLRLLEASTA